MGALTHGSNVEDGDVVLQVADVDRDVVVMVGRCLRSIVDPESSAVNPMHAHDCLADAGAALGRHVVAARLAS